MNSGVFFKLTKVDEAKRQVWGRATEEVVDRSGEVFDYETSKPLFEKWSAGFSEATDGKSLGNIRSMHGKVAAGKVISLDFNDAEKAIDIGTKIIDDNEWVKVLEGVHTGFSIGGNYVKKWKDPALKATRYTADPNEISLVDSPCLQTAKFFDVVKLDGSVIQKAFAAPADGATLAKGMWSVSQFAQMLQGVANMAANADSESDLEGDNSPVPAKLKTWLGLGIDVFREMAEEETAELLESLKDPAALPEPAVLELSEPAGDLGKVGARHSAADKDHLQAIHDHAASMGAECAGAAKAEPVGDLAKLDAEKSEALAKAETLEKALAEAKAESETLAKRVQELEAQPEPPKAAVADLPGVAMNKAQDAGVEDPREAALRKAVESNDPHEMTKFILKYGGKPMA